MQTHNHKRLYVGPSTIPQAGFGLFLGERAERHDFVQEYVGEVVTQMEAERRGSIYDIVNRSYLFDLNDDFSVDATRKGNKMRFANHSKQPNCYARRWIVDGEHHIGLFAARAIEPHEEIFFDYNYDKEKDNLGHRQAKANVGWLKDARLAGRVNLKS